MKKNFVLSFTVLFLFAAGCMQSGPTEITNEPGNQIPQGDFRSSKPVYMNDDFTKYYYNYLTFTPDSLLYGYRYFTSLGNGEVRLDSLGETSGYELKYEQNYAIFTENKNPFGSSGLKFSWEGSGILRLTTAYFFYADSKLLTNTMWVTPYPAKFYVSNEPDKYHYENFNFIYYGENGKGYKGRMDADGVIVYRNDFSFYYNGEFLDEYHYYGSGASSWHRVYEYQKLLLNSAYENYTYFYLDENGNTK